MLAVVAAAGAVAVSALVFPYLTVNSDESVYLVQADALRHGHLFPPAPEPGDAFVPWLSVERDGHYVTKYTPVHAAVVALAELLGHRRVALALLAGALVVATWAAASSVLRSRRLGLLAAAFVALSPVVIVQSGTFLPYLGNLVLLIAFVAAVGRRRWAVAGLVLGLAFFARPFDALVFGLPFVVWLLARRRWAEVGRLAAGAVGPGILVLLYFRAATGSPFRAPFNLLDPSDSVGFGSRRMTPYEAPVEFGIDLGSRAMGTHALLMSFWTFGGLVLVALAVAGCTRVRRSDPLLPLALTAITVPLGYLFFWGTYNALSWGGPFHLGPYYWMPVLLPLAVLAAAGWEVLETRDRVVSRLALAGMALLAGAVTVDAVSTGREFTSSDRKVWAAVDDASPSRAIVFLQERQLGHPIQLATNGGDRPGGDVVWALDRGPCRNDAVVQAFPGRRAYVLLMSGRYRARPPDPSLEVRLEPATVGC